MAMLLSTRMKATTIARPGTCPSPSKWTSRNASMAWANVATNNPIASWLGRSCRNVCTMRGENWPMANWTTTIVIVNTKVANDTMLTAIVSRMAVAASGPPVSHLGTSSNPNKLSTAIVPIETTTPASTHSTGMNHKLLVTLVDLARAMAQVQLLGSKCAPQSKSRRRPLPATPGVDTRAARGDRVSRP